MSRLLTSGELPKFQHLVDAYILDPGVIDVFRSSNFVVLAGPSGAGKDTLRDSLIKSHPKSYQPVLSTTSRPPRDDEKDKVDYHFRSVEQIEEALLKREFFQTALVHNQQVSCLHIDEITKLEDEQIGLSILVVQTEAELSSIKNDIKTIFIIPPDLTTLKKRLGNERPLSDEEIGRRMHASKFEMLTALERSNYYCLVSDDLEVLTRQAHKFLKKNDRDLQADQQARKTISAILNTLSI